ncbi:MAG: DNA-3-methyladenine glycosylase [Planctomycetota bacterium]|nr:MAG: DNA-3-methyladenine glycosylase [Planctomycetota bacterium]
MAVRRLRRSFFARHSVAVAPELLGLVLLKDGVGGPIIEAEAYHEEEPSCHAHGGRTARNQSLFLRGGHLYVYRIHRSLCANVSTGPPGSGQGVLVRALLPTDGRDRIARRRGGRPERIWTDGPGKVCQALAISLDDDGQDLLSPGGVRLVDRGHRPRPDDVEVGPRVGISRAVDLPWRFLWHPPRPLGAPRT